MDETVANREMDETVANREMGDSVANRELNCPISAKIGSVYMFFSILSPSTGVTRGRAGSSVHTD